MYVCVSHGLVCQMCRALVSCHVCHALGSHMSGSSAICAGLWGHICRAFVSHAYVCVMVRVELLCPV